MSLYTTGFFIRRSLILFLIFLGFLISIGIIGTIIKNVSDNSTTTTPESPSLAYGSITSPKLVSPTIGAAFKPQTFTIDTATGLLPDFTSSFLKSGSSSQYVNVYKVDVPEVQNDSRQRGLDLGNALGFSTDSPKESTDLKYVFSDGKRQLQYYIDSKTFDLYTTNIPAADTSSDTKTSPDNVTQFVKDFLTGLNFNVNEPLSYFVSEYVKYNTSTSSWELSPNNAPTNFIRTTYMRYSRSRGNSSLPDSLTANQDGTNDTGSPSSTDPTVVKEFYPDYDYSPMYFIVKNTTPIKNTDIVEAKFYDYTYDLTRPQTYYSKSATAAYQDLQNGNSSLVVLRAQDSSLLDPTVISKVSEVDIKSVQLGYLYTGGKGNYVLPIYIFHGEFVISQQGTSIKKGDAIYYVYAFNN